MCYSAVEWNAVDSSTATEPHLYNCLSQTQIVSTPLSARYTTWREGPLSDFANIPSLFSLPMLFALFKA